MQLFPSLYVRVVVPIPPNSYEGGSSPNLPKCPTTFSKVSTKSSLDCVWSCGLVGGGRGKARILTCREFGCIPLLACHKLFAPCIASMRMGRRLILASVWAPEKMGKVPRSGWGFNCPSGKIPISKPSSNACFDNLMKFFTEDVSVLKVFPCSCSSNSIGIKPACRKTSFRMGFFSSLFH